MCTAQTRPLRLQRPCCTWSLPPAWGMPGALVCQHSCSGSQSCFCWSAGQARGKPVSVNSCMLFETFVCIFKNYWFVGVWHDFSTLPHIYLQMKSFIWEGLLGRDGWVRTYFKLIVSPLNIMEYLFTVQVAELWHRLTREAMGTPSLQTLKSAGSCTALGGTAPAWTWSRSPSNPSHSGFCEPDILHCWNKQLFQGKPISVHLSIL